MGFVGYAEISTQDACDAVGLMVSLIWENAESWSALALFFSTMLTCPFSCGDFEQVTIADAVSCTVREAQCKQKTNDMSILSRFNDIYSWYHLYRPFVQGYLEANSLQLLQSQMD